MVNVRPKIKNWYAHLFTTDSELLTAACPNFPKILSNDGQMRSNESLLEPDAYLSTDQSCSVRNTPARHYIIIGKTRFQHTTERLAPSLHYETLFILPPPHTHTYHPRLEFPILFLVPENI